MDGISILPLTGEFGSSMSNLLKEGKYSDLTITCGDDSYAVHKAIVCSRSPFFAACCDGDFKEAKSGVVDLPDDDPLAVKMMIRYLYTGTYPTPSKSAPNGALPRASANTPAASTPAASTSVAQSQTSTDPSTASAPATFVFGAQPQTSVNPAEPSTPVSAPHPAQTQDSMLGYQPGRHNSRNRREGRHSGNQVRGSQPSRSSIPATPAPAPVPAATPPRASVASTPAPVQASTVRRFHLAIHAKIYALGEKYEIRDLKALALQKFAFEAQRHHSTPSFRQGAREAYTSTVDEDRGMRNVVVETVVKNRHLLLDAEFQSVVKETSLGFDLLIRFAYPDSKS